MYFFDIFCWWLRLHNSWFLIFGKPDTILSWSTTTYLTLVYWLHSCVFTESIKWQRASLIQKALIHRNYCLNKHISYDLSLHKQQNVEQNNKPFAFNMYGSKVQRTNKTIICTKCLEFYVPIYHQAMIQ